MSEVVKMCEKGVTTCCRMLAVMATLFCAVAALPSFAAEYVADADPRIESLENGKIYAVIACGAGGYLIEYPL